LSGVKLLAATRGAAANRDTATRLREKFLNFIVFFSVLLSISRQYNGAVDLNDAMPVQWPKTKSLYITTT
jgi:hypothetical protein